MNKLFLLLLLTACSPSKSDRFVVSKAITDTTVKVTNLAQNSGGSGTVIENSDEKSVILTNAHVCKVVKYGGLVTSTTGIQAFVNSYIVSNFHDLCLITVSKDFKSSATVADTAYVPYEKATVSGHPALYPNIVTFGHFAGNKLVSVVYGYRECTEMDKISPDTSLLCAILGRLPLIKTLESTVISATIMPGSSGSGVFNYEGKLSAVVFAGMGDLAYGLTVPYEYLKRFLTEERSSLTPQTPILNGGSDEDSASRRSIEEQYQTVCKTKPELSGNRICDLILDGLRK